MHGLRTSPRGFTLVEAVVAVGLLVTVIAGAGALFTQSAHLAARDRRAPIATAAATAKLEQLRGLAWTFDDLGGATSDTTSDTSIDPPAPGSGSGLSASPAGTLDADMPGWVDYVDDRGRPLGAASTARLSASYARRWAVIPADGSPDLLELRVCIVPHTAAAAPRRSSWACFSTARARR